MEAIAAVSLASNVAQSSDHALMVVSWTLEVSHTRKLSPGQNHRMEEAVTDMKDLASRIQPSNRAVSNLIKRDKKLEELALSCIAATKEITTTLSKLDGRSLSGNIFDGIQKAGLSVFMKRELRDVGFRLRDIQASASTHLLALLRRQQAELNQTLRMFVDSTDALEKEISPKIDEMISHLSQIIRNKPASDQKTPRPRRAWIKLPSKELDEETPAPISVTRKHTPLTKRLHEVVTYYVERMGSLVEKKQEAVLQLLHFNLLRERELSIVNAHEKTFSWVFQHDSNINFTQWLQNHGSIYWLAGMPGSGKSTLMKFLKQHPTTSRLLRQWASADHDEDHDQDCDLIIADYYFWSLGTAVQKSQEGLFRSVLLQILRKRPDLMPIALERRWSAAYSNSFHSWSRSELLHAMCILGTLQFPRLKICVFIDGLDESGDDHKELLQSIWKIGSCPNYKICVSSRELHDFAEAFESSTWKMYLQDLTDQDIKQYIRDVLGNDARFRRLQTRDRDVIHDLTFSMTRKSQGVFLWVVLAIRVLLRELDREGMVPDLQRRLEELPSDLVEYFDRMFVEMEDVYEKRVVRLLLTMSYAGSSFPLFTFHFLYFEDGPLLSGSIPFLRDWPNVNVQEMEAMAAEKRRLIAQCKDLVLISAEPDAHPLFSERVGFAHRTVSDYLCTTSIRPKLLELAGLDFDPKRVLFAASIGQVRATIHLNRYQSMRPYIKQWFLECIYYAYQCEIAGHPESPWLDELEAIILQSYNQWGFSDAMQNLIEMPQIKSFIELACKFDLLLHVEAKVPDCSASKLDLLAKGWRKPCWIRQPPNLEVLPKMKDDINLAWRLGAKYRQVAEAVEVEVPLSAEQGGGEELETRRSTPEPLCPSSRRQTLLGKLRGSFNTKGIISSAIRSPRSGDEAGGVIGAGGPGGAGSEVDSETRSSIQSGFDPDVALIRRVKA